VESIGLAASGQAVARLSSDILTSHREAPTSTAGSIADKRE
jgi:hypothetical protein